ncbi:DUF6381 family protein [Streptomyces sp. NPDC058664]|uniref:DUF6381 family protein n=1 Tax=unclassified Streptomyces TaxID=2593676 RepID=UPI0036594B71
MTGEPSNKAEQMRARAEEMTELAERTSDPEERKHLTGQALRLRESSEKESGQAGGGLGMNPR